MVCTKIPILGLFDYGMDFNDGTLCRLPSPTPGTLGATTAEKKQIKTVSNADGHGWLKVTHDSVTKGDKGGGTYPPLPQYLKVEVYKTSTDREYFTIIEGKLRGKTASVKLKPTGTSYLNKIQPIYKKSAKIKFNRKTKQLWYGSKVIPAFTQEIAQPSAPLTPIPLGTWVLELPYEVHNIGASYYSYSDYASTWFRIVTNASDIYQDRYLHPGQVSHGCATVGTNRMIPSYSAIPTTDVVQSLKNWTSLYDFLITSRRDNKSVGTIEVIE